jgi:alcohol dehydrogenase class IV
VPTTSGTGAESTKNAVIADLAKGYKFSFRSERLLARMAVIDPVLTVGVPPAVTAFSGMDALTQLIEAFISKKSQPVTDALALSGIPRVAASLRRAYQDGGDLQARENMAYGSFLSGICLANAGLGAAHGIAAALGAVLGTPHGLACAVLLPHVVTINMPYTADKAAPLCQALTGKAWPDLADNVREVTGFIDSLAGDIGIPARLGTADHSDEMVAKLAGAVSRSSMGGNPVTLSDKETAELIRRIL